MVVFLEIIVIFSAAFCIVFLCSFEKKIDVRLDMTVVVDAIMMLFRAAAYAVVSIGIYLSENICSSENVCS